MIFSARDHPAGISGGHEVDQGLRIDPSRSALIGDKEHFPETTKLTPVTPEEENLEEQNNGQEDYSSATRLRRVIPA